jgi:hypothetical protein
LVTEDDFRIADDIEKPWENGHLMFIAELPSTSFLSLGPGVLGIKNVEVFWWSTDLDPKPTDAWLMKNFPDVKSFIAHIRNAVCEYESAIPDEWKQEILTEIGEDPVQRELFQQQGLMPFVMIDHILINASTGTIAVDCGCHIDPNLCEHGMYIVCKDGAWTFCDDFASIFNESFNGEDD